ncbi:Crp/Fnr family transcriptional regulator [Pedobacter aquatilis]|uniref:Crp/Fnr family transcriptional regulator n=1 Tax=Pedobacter aquatilis TaxID=351343 RepID=UPI00292F4824|nr:Crp/Fnr family transcriptional regulator [Pedobacter aquatilis]
MKEIKSGCDIMNCYLCSRCIAEWQAALDQHKKLFSYKKGESIFSEGEAVNGIYFVNSGAVKVHKRWDKEKEIITRFASQGDIIGHLGLGKKPVYPVSATALLPTTVCYVDRSFFDATLKVNPSLTLDLMQFFANELQESQNMMRNLVHMTVKARIANTFIHLEKQFGIDEDKAINIDLSRQDMASFSGTTYETLFKVINDLSGQGLITQVGKRISISNPMELKKLVDSDNH